MLATPFYDPQKSYQENYAEGPFGEFATATPPPVSPEPPQHTLFGLSVNEPFGIPAGPLVNGRFVKAALAKGFDLPVYKTVRSRAYPCHPWPNVLPVDTSGDLTLEKAASQLTVTDHFSEPISITNSFGVPSANPDVWQPDLADAVQAASPGQVVIGSFQGTPQENGSAEAYIQDFADTARLVAATGVKIIEVNLSCPNEGTAHLLCFDVPRVAQIAATIKEVIGDIPLVLKLAYFTDQAQLEQLVMATAPLVQGYAAINTIASTIVKADGTQALPGEGRLRSGVCGSGIKWAGLEMTERLASLRLAHHFGYSIIGVGGVTSSTDYATYRQAGADAVMSATGAMWNPNLAQEVKNCT